jgi:hypothetical protein
VMNFFNDRYFMLFRSHRGKQGQGQLGDCHGIVALIVFRAGGNQKYFQELLIGEYIKPVKVVKIK